MVTKNKLLKVSDFPQNHENPFLPTAIPQMKSHFTRAYVNAAGADQKAILNAVDPNTGEVVGNTTFVKKKIVDDEQFAKIFLAQFEAFFDLSQAAIRVFGYITTCMMAAKDMVVFDKNDCKKYTHYTASSTIYKGIAELLNCGIIARGWSDNVFYINPLIVWNGSRVTFVTQYEKKSSKARLIEDENQLSMQFEEFNAEIETDEQKQLGEK